MNIDLKWGEDLSVSLVDLKDGNWVIQGQTYSLEKSSPNYFPHISPDLYGWKFINKLDDSLEPFLKQEAEDLTAIIESLEDDIEIAQTELEIITSFIPPYAGITPSPIIEMKPIRWSDDYDEKYLYIQKDSKGPQEGYLRAARDAYETLFECVLYTLFEDAVDFSKDIAKPTLKIASWESIKELGTTTIYRVDSGLGKDTPNWMQTQMFEAVFNDRPIYRTAMSSDVKIESEITLIIHDYLKECLTKGYLKVEIV